MGLPDLLHAAADVLDRADPLEPLHLAIADRDIQITFADTVTMADQRASVDRLAAATGATSTLSGLGASSYTSYVGTCPAAPCCSPPPTRP
ncbi:MAG: hypothetical protein JO362_14320 [Streptomycetaceae bacterium]|nr:hypothetical protein [Streptomycetaceae bacterium]